MYLFFFFFHFLRFVSFNGNFSIFKGFHTKKINDPCQNFSGPFKYTNSFLCTYWKEIGKFLDYCPLVGPFSLYSLLIFSIIISLNKITFLLNLYDFFLIHLCKFYVYDEFILFNNLYKFKLVIKISTQIIFYKILMIFFFF